MQLIPMAVGMGQQGAQNPNASLGGQGGLGLDKIDPLGKFIVGKGGDPYNLYGEKDNPNALFFPSGGGANGNSALPAPSGSINPMFYDPRSFGKRPPLAPGKFNAMASALAGPQYQPQLAGGKGGSAPTQGPSPGGGKGAALGPMNTGAQKPGPMSLSPQMLQRLRDMQGGRK